MITGSGRYRIEKFLGPDKGIAMAPPVHCASKAFREPVHQQCQDVMHQARRIKVLAFSEGILLVFLAQG
jgi:hypothetical protein